MNDNNNFCKLSLVEHLLSGHPGILMSLAQMELAKDPLLVLMSNFATGAGTGKDTGSIPLSQEEVRPKTLAQKLLPILHVYSVWVLLMAFFIFWMELEVFRAQNSAIISSSNR
jgi:hypothetical protein